MTKLKEGPRYRRALTTKEPYESILRGGPLGFLLSNIPLPPDDSFALDVQLREKNKVMYYHGTTCLLTVKFSVTADHGEVTRIGMTAAPSYSKCSEYTALMRRDWTLADAPKLRDAFQRYLSSVISVTADRYYRRPKAEGRWQNRLCIEWGPQATPDTEFMIIDRECVIGFDTTPEKEAFYSSQNRPYLEIRRQLQTDAKETFGQVREKAFGDELDMLALDKQGNLVVIELKHGSYHTGIYWGPLQALTYRDAFRSTLSAITPGIKALVKQKVALGLLPESALSRLPDDFFTDVKAILAIAEPEHEHWCWERLSRVVRQANLSAKTTDRDNLRLITVGQGKGS